MAAKLMMIKRTIFHLRLICSRLMGLPPGATFASFYKCNDNALLGNV